MTNTIRNLLISLSSHMAYMQGQLEARHELDDPEDFYWYRESVALRQKVTDALGKEEPAALLPLADAVATAESECLHFLTTETGRSLTPDLIESLYGQFRGIIAGLVDALAQADEPAVPEGKEPAAVTGQPSDEEVEVLVDRLGLIRGHANHPCGFWIDDGDAGAIARAVLARWGNPVPAPAANEEVAELVVWLEEEAEILRHINCDDLASKIARAAELLQRQALVPVSVSERLPGDQLCWWFEADEDCGYGSSWTLLRIRGSATGYTHWLPAHALPLPEVGE